MSQGVIPIKATAKPDCSAGTRRAFPLTFKRRPLALEHPSSGPERAALPGSLSKQTGPSYTPFPFAWWKLGFSNQRRLGQLTQWSVLPREWVQGFPQLAWSLVLTDSLQSWMPGSLILVVVDGKSSLCYSLLFWHEIKDELHSISI